MLRFFSFHLRWLSLQKFTRNFWKNRLEIKWHSFKVKYSFKMLAFMFPRFLQLSGWIYIFPSNVCRDIHPKWNKKKLHQNWMNLESATHYGKWHVFWRFPRVAHTTHIPWWRDHLKSSEIKFIYLWVCKKMAFHKGFQVELRQDQNHLLSALTGGESRRGRGWEWESKDRGQECEKQRQGSGAREAETGVRSERNRDRGQEWERREAVIAVRSKKQG